MTWVLPLPHKFIASDDGESFRHLPVGTTALPLAPHPGSFAFKRKHHVHEGVDLYAGVGTPVFAVEDGEVVAVEKFTGDFANPPTPWWHNTYALLVEGASGVVLYGEINKPVLAVGDSVLAGQILASVTPVLKNPKNGRPDCMLHLELHDHGTRRSYEWAVNDGLTAERPRSLRDPTPYLLQALIG